jgi:hypothetical protein
MAEIDLQISLTACGRKGMSLQAINKHGRLGAILESRGIDSVEGKIGEFIDMVGATGLEPVTPAV